MKRERLHLSVHTNVETGLDWNGRYFIAYTNGASMFFRCPKEARKWLKLPAKIPSREAYDSWIASLEAADQARVSKKAKPLTSEAPIKQTSPSLSQELLATGFGPECHLDETDPMDDLRQASADVSGVEVHLDKSDPNYQTKMIT